MGSYVLGFQEIDQTQVAVVGGKGAHLGELSRIEGICVPAGFCVTTDAFQRIMAEAPSIDDRLDRLSRLRPDDREAIRALSAEAGLTMAALEQPDAIILDMRMPLMGGLEFLRRLRQDTALRTLPVGIVTGDYYLGDAVTSELSALGARLRQKPIYIDDLLALARELLAARAAEV